MNDNPSHSFTEGANVQPRELPYGTPQLFTAAEARQLPSNAPEGADAWEKDYWDFMEYFPGIKLTEYDWDRLSNMWQGGVKEQFEYMREQFKIIDEFEGRPPCVKCSSTDIHKAWHHSINDCSFRDRYERQQNPKGEHLHYYCRGCGYTWFGPCKDKELKDAAAQSKEHKDSKADEVPQRREGESLGPARTEVDEGSKGEPAEKAPLTSEEKKSQKERLVEEAGELLYRRFPPGYFQSEIRKDPFNEFAREIAHIFESYPVEVVHYIERPPLRIEDG